MTERRQSRSQGFLDRLAEDQAADQERRQATAQARDARLKVDALVQSLTHLTQHDPEQEVKGMALPVMAEVIEIARNCVSGDPVVSAVQEIVEIVSAEFIGSDQTVRAADALVVATQLRIALHAYRPEHKR